MNEESEVEALAVTTEPEDGIEEELLSHTYHLRPDLEVELQLPTDLTMDEARRLASFIESLPFE